MKRIIIFLLLSLALSIVFGGICFLAMNYTLVADIYAGWYKVFCYILSVISGCVCAYIIWSPKKF